jgi:FAD dependent oxidoreductase/Glucose inhibited division protein A
MPGKFRLRVAILSRLALCVLAVFPIFASTSQIGRSEEHLIEAESFENIGGWSLDTQFIQQMGSPYLLAHGLGKPVADASTTIEIKQAGEYVVWVRTMDWVARWKAPGTPGKFAVSIDDHLVSDKLGTQGERWNWQLAGKVKLTRGKHTLLLQDATGFDGRCDAIYLATDAASVPDNSDEILCKWRRQLLGIEESIETLKGYDLVVVGGGYSGMGAAISAARMGCKVALIQDRGVLGGNGSSEVRVWAQGLIRRGRFPRIGEIIEEFADKAPASPAAAEAFGDSVKEQVIRDEKNIDLFLFHHGFRVAKTGERIAAVEAIDIRSGRIRRFEAPLFADCTGHAWIGSAAAADWVMEPTGRMGMSNMWTWAEADEPTTFPETPWALPLTMKDFPYPRDYHAEWFWESGFDKDAIQDAEGIRDWNLRASYGAFNAMKNGDGAAKHTKAILTWLAYIGGPRESRQLMGDVVLTQDDIVTKRDFPDGCVPSTWSIDLHYPKKEFAEKFPDNPFISIAEHDRRIDRNFGYPVPYRCFYSRNVPNLFMAGRCISVTHQALGTVRVMKTCGMMGEVVGKAASLCRQNQCEPRAIYEEHLSELIQLLQLPGKARRESFDKPIAMPEVIPELPSATGVESGRKLSSFQGVIVDETKAELVGKWTHGEGLKGYVGWGYHYASPETGNVADFRLTVPADGKYLVRISVSPHANRASNAPIDILIDNRNEDRKLVDMRKTYPDGFCDLMSLTLKKGQVVTVRLIAEGAGGIVHADAAHLSPIN